MKTALITGGTSGVGLSIAKALIQKDYKAYLIGSNLDKGKMIEAELNTLSQESTEFIQLDLSRINEVKIFSNQFLESQNKIDVLANIAGIMAPKRQVTNEGFEKTFAINYLSAFVLSTQLVPLLEKAPNGRIVNVAGVPSQILKVKIDFEDMDFSTNYSFARAAKISVHAKTVLTEILSEQYKSKKIDVNSFHPGWVRSDLMKNQSFGLRLIDKIISPLFSESSETGIYVCSSNEIQGTTGKLFTKKEVLPLNFEKKYKERLWQESENMIGRV